MPPRDATTRPPHALRWALVAVLGAAAGLWLLAVQPEALRDGAPAGAAVATVQQPDAMVVSSAVSAVSMRADPINPWPSSGWLAPPDARTPAAPTLTLSELREVQAALASTPPAVADQAAAAEAMFFADVAQRFHQVQSTAQESEPGELRALAQMLDTMLDTRLQRGDINWPDARLVKAAVLGALRPQDAARDEQVQDWEIRLRQGPLREPPDKHHPPR